MIIDEPSVSLLQKSYNQVSGLQLGGSGGISMKKIAPLFLILPAAVFGDDPFACVDPDIVDAFLGNAYSGRSTYSTDLPPALAGLRVPDTFWLIGSEVNNRKVQAVYKTRQSPDAAVPTAVDTLAGGEWRSMPNLGHMPRGGFQTRVTPVSAIMCRDSEPGILSIHASMSQAQTLLTYTLNTYSEERDCSSFDEQAAMRGRGDLAFWDKLPQLALPGDVQSTNAGMGGGGNEYHSRITVTGGMDRDSLLSFLGDQVRDQGWVFDSGWSGNYSAGSVWSKKSPEGETLIGMLHAFGESGDSYDVRFGLSAGMSGRTGSFGLAGNAVIQSN